MKKPYVLVPVVRKSVQNTVTFLTHLCSGNGGPPLRMTYSLLLSQGHRTLLRHRDPNLNMLSRDPTHIISYL